MEDLSMNLSPEQIALCGFAVVWAVGAIGDAIRRIAQLASGNSQE